MRGIWKKLKQLIRDVIEVIREFIDYEDDFKEVKEKMHEEEMEEEYRKEVIENFKKQKGRTGVVSFSQKQVNKFNEKKVRKTNELLDEEEKKRDDILSSLFSDFSSATAAIADTIWSVVGNLPKEIFESMRDNMYKIMKEQGETELIKPSINPQKFYGKYHGEGKNYLELFNEKERSFLALSLFVDKVDIAKRAEALIWYYDRENDLEWGNIYLAGLHSCDPRRRVDLRSAYIDIFTEIWDDEEEKMHKKRLFDLAKASDRFFNEVFFRMKMERLAGIEWFKDAYGREFIET